MHILPTRQQDDVRSIANNDEVHVSFFLSHRDSDLTPRLKNPSVLASAGG